MYTVQCGSPVVTSQLVFYKDIHKDISRQVDWLIYIKNNNELSKNNLKSVLSNRLIAINRIQNKSLCLHNICVYTEYMNIHEYI